LLEPGITPSPEATAARGLFSMRKTIRLLLTGWVNYRENVAVIPLERLARGVKANLPVEMLRSPTQVRKVTKFRQEFVLKAVKMGHRPSAVAEFLRCSPSAISKIIARSL